MASQLRSFSKTAKSVKETQAENRADGKRAKQRQPGEAPSGYDQELWTLAILFQSYAWADKIELAADLPVIHDAIGDLVTRYDMRGKSGRNVYRQEVRGCARRELPESLAARCWYHWPPQLSRVDEQEARVLTWVEVVEIIMAEFWSRIQNEHATDYFRQYFAEYGLAMATHWKNLRIAAAIDDRPRDAVRPIVRRRISGGTMAHSGEEG